MHCKSYIPGYYTMRDINEETRNSWPLSYENKILNRHLYNGCLLNSSTGYSEYDKQMLKQTILEHEAIFRKQVYELHRLYGIQKDLMEGLQKNDLTIFSTCTIKPKNSLTSLEPQSQITRSMWQKSHQPALSSTMSREITIDTNASVSPISFFESNLQSCFGPWEIGASVRDSETNAGLRTPAKRMLDHRFQADVYIDTEVTEHSQKERIASSSTLTTAPYSRNYDVDPENEVKLTLSNVCIKNGRESGHKYYSDNKNNLFHGLSDLNETVKEAPLEETDFSFPQLFGPETQLDESYRIDGSLRSNNFLQLTSFSKSQDCVERDSSNIQSTLKQELSQISLQIHRKEGQFESNLTSHSGKEKCLMAFEPLQQSQIKANEILLADNKKTGIEFMPKKGSSMDISEKCFHKNGFNHGFDRESCSSLQLDLSYSNMNLFSIKSSSFDIQNRETAPKNEVLSEMDEDCKEVSPVLSWLKNKSSSNKFLNLNSLSSSIENEEEAEKRTICIPSNLSCSEEIMQRNDLSMHAKIQPNQVNELRLDSFFGGINISVVNSERSFRKHIDLNCEAQYIDEPGISQMPEASVSLSASKALTLLHMDASRMTLEEDNSPCIHDMLIKEAAENMIKLSLDKFMPGDNGQSLHWFVDLALLNSESSSSEAVISSEMDLFEQMTLQLEEMKPDDKTCCNPQEAEKVKSYWKSRAVLPLKKPRRRYVRKRRQKRDFQKDTLPGLVTLSRQEVVEDLQVIGGLMKASGYHWEVGTGRQNGGQNSAQVRSRRRPQPRKTSVKKQPNRNPKTLFEFDGPGMIGWGKTTRRCRRPRCPPAQTVTTALT